MSDTRGWRCDGCLHGLLEDHGYSNYTVEGTDFTCKLGRHPKGTFDRFYGEDMGLQYAEQCANFVAGKPEVHDVGCPHDCGCKGTACERKAHEA